ncbi:MAG TPA: hypothetical protein GXX20_09300 [Clostridiaceae bacterium]|nr:hypothetical protein [Clostridiaceae bacterium]
MTKKNNVSTFKVAATYIGTVIGAGFASGQEILQFFSVFREKGLMGLVAVTVMFILFGYIVMDFGRKLGSTSHLEIIRFTGGRFFGTIADYIISFFLFGSLTAMIAGAGAMAAQEFHIPAAWGNFFMAAITCVTVLTGINGVINSISFIVPFLIMAVLGVSIGSFFTLPENAGTVYAQIVPDNELIKNWFWSAILYTSYNIVLSIAVLAPLGSEANDMKSIRNGAILGGLGLGLGALAINIAITRNINNVIDIEVPMAYIAGQISQVVKVVYIAVLLAEIYTTAVGSLYGFTARITDIKDIYGKLIVIEITILSFIASQFGFSNLVKYLYPVIGYGGIIILACLLYKKIKIK